MLHQSCAKRGIKFMLSTKVVSIAESFFPMMGEPQLQVSYEICGKLQVLYLADRLLIEPWPSSR